MLKSWFRVLEVQFLQRFLLTDLLPHSESLFPVFSFVLQCIIIVIKFIKPFIKFINDFNRWKSFFPLWRSGPTRAMTSLFLRFLDHTQWHTTVVRTPLDEWSARRRYSYLTTQNSHDKHPCYRRNSNSVALGERPQTHDKDRAAAGISE
jgi:hypothetical protein